MEHDKEIDVFTRHPALDASDYPFIFSGRNEIFPENIILKDEIIECVLSEENKDQYNKEQVMLFFPKKGKYFYAIFPKKEYFTCDMPVHFDEDLIYNIFIRENIIELIQKQRDENDNSEFIGMYSLGLLIDKITKDIENECKPDFKGSGYRDKLLMVTGGEEIWNNIKHREDKRNIAYISSYVFRALRSFNLICDRFDEVISVVSSDELSWYSDLFVHANRFQANGELSIILNSDVLDNLSGNIKTIDTDNYLSVEEIKELANKVSFCSYPVEAYEKYGFVRMFSNKFGKRIIAALITDDQKDYEYLKDEDVIKSTLKISRTNSTSAIMSFISETTTVSLFKTEKALRLSIDNLVTYLQNNGNDNKYNRKIFKYDDKYYITIAEIPEVTYDNVKI